MTLPLMPKATAVWLIEKTALTFEQIAEFCGMHPLEVQAIADGEVAAGIVGYDPIANMQLTAAEIARCEKDSSARLKLLPSASPPPKKQRGARYTVRFSLDGGATQNNQRAFLGAPALSQPADRHPQLDGVTANAPITVAALRAGLVIKWADWAAKQPDTRLRAAQLLVRDGSGLRYSSQLAAGSEAQLSLPAVPALGNGAEHELWLLAEDGQGRLLATRYRLR